MDEGRECRVAYDGRVSTPEYIEHSDTELRLDFLNLHAWHDSWDAYAAIEIVNGSYASLRSAYRRGRVPEVQGKSHAQHPWMTDNPMPVTIRCESDTGFRHVLSMDGTGSATVSSFAAFDSSFRNVDEAYECRIAVDGRLTSPVMLDHSSAGTLRFDYLNLAAYYDAWEAYAYTVLGNGSATGMSSSYRRGHADHVWKPDTEQNGEVSPVEPSEVRLLCQ